MTTKRFVVGLLILTGLASMLAWWMRGPGDAALTRPRTDLPWQVQVLSPERLRVFDLELPRSTLRDAIAKFGQLESVSLFQSKQGVFSLEAYFGKVSLGPLKARVIATLDAPQSHLRELAAGALTMKYTKDGERRFVLDQERIAAQLSRPLRALSYIPAYSGLDADFFRKRFGEPAYYLKINDHSVQWFYPERGVRILIDVKGKEVLEYQPPADFKIPKGAGKNR